MLIQILIIIITGVAAGFFNTVAGGGSLLTMPMLIFLGLPSAVANGTNRIALSIQNIVAVINFKSKGLFDWRLALLLSIPAILGSLIGANLAIGLPDEIFNKLLAIIMIIVILIILWNPTRKFSSLKDLSDKKVKTINIIVFFLIGIYGGLIQAGVGIIIIAALTLLTRFSLAKINSYKVFIVGAYILCSLGIFIINGKVNWIYGLSLALGNGIGGYIGSNFSVKKNDKWIKAILVTVVCFMSLKLFGIIKL